MGVLGTLLLGAAISLSIDGNEHSALAYLGFYGVGFIALGVSAALWVRIDRSKRARPGDPQRVSLLRRRPLATLGIAAAAALLVGLGGGLILASGNDAGRSCSKQALTKPSGADLAAQRIAASSPGPPEARTPISMRPSPISLAVGSDGVWVAQVSDGSVSLIDPKLNRPVGDPIPVGGAPFAIALAEEVAWVSREDGTLVAIDRETKEIMREYEYGAGSGEVALGAGSVWVNNYDKQEPGKITRIDPCGDGDGDPISIGERANTVEFAFGSVWVSDSLTKAVYRLEPATEKVTSVPLPSEADPQDIGEGGGYLWVASWTRDLFQVDPREEEVVGAPIPIGAAPAGIVVAAGAVWLPNNEWNSVTRVDLKTLESEQGAVRVGAGPTDIAAGFGRIWVANRDDADTSVTPIRP